VLKADETLRTTYANLKKALQEQFSQDRQAYTAAKHTFIRDILQQNNGSQGHEADCLQRPLVSRSRFQQQLSASVKPQLGFSKTLFLATDSTIVWSLRLWGLY
jgi:hypothetical protein